LARHSTHLQKRIPLLPTDLFGSQSAKSPHCRKNVFYRGYIGSNNRTQTNLAKTDGRGFVFGSQFWPVVVVDSGSSRDCFCWNTIVLHARAKIARVKKLHYWKEIKIRWSTSRFCRAHSLQKPRLGSPCPAGRHYWRQDAQQH
jgi:hypothetical protein